MFEVICEPTMKDRIYLTEALSPIYQNLSRRFPLLSGSEYFPDQASGEMVQTHARPVRNEDVTKLSFAEASMDIVLCFDVLEHVPDYRSALREFYRVLDKGGQLVVSVPFSFKQETNVRARIDSQGNIEHLVEPSYHGDPLSDQGVLSYYDFGMELLDDMRLAGFQECFLLCYCSRGFAYLNQNVVFIARKL
ncbi:MAG TPA: class I SAM-dependent methyltransferase [Xanthomonadales bacterium]